jgi:hypothetical protein
VARRAKILRFPGPRLPASQTPGRDRLVEVHRCSQPESMVVRSFFESEGVPVLLQSRLAHSVHPFSVGDQGEVVILVPHREAIRSRLLLERIAPRP